MGKYHAYAEYKDSEINWLGEIPSEWKIARFKWLNNHGKAFASGPFGSSIGSKFYQDEGIPVIRGNNLSLGAEKPKFKDWGYVYLDEKKADELSNAEVLKGDLVFTARGTVGQVGLVPNSNELSWGRAILSANQLRFRNHGKALKSEFLWYLFSSWFVRTQVTIGSDSVAQPNLNLGSLKDLHLIVPSINEQTQIADFLDHETAKIDTLIEKQQQLIKLLKEKRQAVISHAVTKGLNPQAPMKDSGVEWLGEVPEHWEVKRVRHAFDIDNNLRTPIDRQSRMDMIGEYRYYGPTGVLNHINRFNVEGKYFLLGEDGDHFLKFKEKSMTILVDGQFNVNNHAHLLKGKGTCSTEWGCLLFEHKDIFPWLIKQGVGRYKLQKTVLLDIPVVVPPEKEQLYILGEINKRKRTFDEIEDKANQSINMLKERRTALISAAVTGKIDVRNWQAPTSQDQALEQTA
ncbi:restriction endonuclease subunit S [Vibrio parahaemolyticus]